MKLIVKSGIIILLTICCLSCSTTKNPTKTEESITTGISTIKGVVKSIEYGKDGYTARIKADDGKIYFATISIPNLGNNAEKYREFKKEEIVKLKGEVWLLGDEYRITVNDIRD